eukprot:1689747-Pyramimonas_sp.AAC.1
MVDDVGVHAFQGHALLVGEEPKDHAFLTRLLQVTRAQQEDVLVVQRQGEGVVAIEQRARSIDVDCSRTILGAL